MKQIEPGCLYYKLQTGEECIPLEELPDNFIVKMPTDGSECRLYIGVRGPWWRLDRAVTWRDGETYLPFCLGTSLIRIDGHEEEQEETDKVVEVCY